MKILEWIQDWYIKQCDGEWEHEYGIKIYNVDNPGWVVEIDLMYTSLMDVTFSPIMEDNGDDDWFFIKIENNKYTASGDPKKLVFLLENFKKIVLEDFSSEQYD